jgi:cyclopropane fatty-acyl-phospholipid synthase-like methyltransferase
MLYESINVPVFSRIPKTAKSILDIGCGTGELGKKIKENIDCRVVGVTYSESEALIAQENLDKVIVDDLNHFDSSAIGKFDCIICSHILEHINYPEILLQSLQKNMDSSSVIIIALPNILHFKQRLEFLKGNFKYTDGGIMDRTHFRFFDWQTAHSLLNNSGYKIIDSESTGCFPLMGLRKIIPAKLISEIDSIATKNFPGMFGFQFIFACTAKE